MSCAALPLPVFGGSTPAKAVAAATPTAVSPLSHGGNLYVPEIWARDSVRILEENMVVAAVVNRGLVNTDGFNDTVRIRGK